MSERRYATYPSLAGRTVLVTGGASGIGEAIVRAFAEQGAKVGFVDIQEADGRALAEELTRAGAKVRFVRADLTDIAALKAAVADIDKALGPISVLVNNAANDDRHDWRDETPESFDRRLRTPTASSRNGNVCRTASSRMRWRGWCFSSPPTIRRCARRRILSWMRGGCS
jgi:NAD(P)-dependent dehydrogenase (short-subunit alcohol dehydrogenase family)